MPSTTDQRHILELRRQLAEAEARAGNATGYRTVSDAEHRKMVDHQARADAVMQMHGARAPEPLTSETTPDYRRRLIGLLQPHSSTWKSAPATSMPEQILDLVETQVFAEAKYEAEHPTNVPKGELREVKTVDRSGRQVSNFYGSPSAWTDQFKMPTQYLVGITRPERFGY